MNIGIVGAGISGLSFAKYVALKYSHINVTLLEKEHSYGGIAKVKDINGIPYHMVGGHCFNSKHKEVLDFIFQDVMPKDEWHQVRRIAKIFIDGNVIDYPIEFSVQQISKFNKKLAIDIIKDFISSSGSGDSQLDKWFISKFGKTLAELYFIPYNKKIWACDPSEMSSSWVVDKLPIPNKDDFIESLILEKSDNMPHSVFYYPRSGTQNTFIEKLAKGLNIEAEIECSSIIRDSDKWIVNDVYEFDELVVTTPLNELCNIVQDVPDEIRDMSAMLHYNPVTTSLWETDELDFTWSYFPDPSTLFHRVINIGAFLEQKKNYAICEVVGDVELSVLKENGQKIEFLKNCIDCNVSKHAYVVFDRNYESVVGKLQAFYSGLGLNLLGRFGEWQYHNMDVCIKKSMELADNMLGGKR